MFYKKSISVIGLGYVGLPLAIILANKFKILGYDNNPKKLEFSIADLESKKLKNLLKKNIKKRLFFLKKPKYSEVNFICVSSNKKSKSVANDTNLSFKIIKDIITNRKKSKKTIIVLMSTSQIGYSEKIENYLKKKKLDKNFYFLYTPERVFPSNLYNELIYNNRLIGNNDKDSFDIIKSLLATFVKGEIIDVDHKSAELVKIIENTYRNVNIGFANELLRISMKENLDINKILKYANQHPRVSILNPGIGIGGHCIPVDPKFLTARYENIPLIENSILTNDKQISFFSNKLTQYIKKNEIKSILFLGTAYKANVPDFRNSPSIELLKNIIKISNINISVADPFLKSIKYLGAEVVNSNNLNLDNYNLILLLVPHKIFINQLTKKYNLIDLSGYLDYANINSL